MVMVAVGTFIAGRYVFKDGFAGAGWRWGRFRYYMFALLLPAFLWFLPTGIDILIGNLEVPGELPFSVYRWFVLLPIITLIPGFGEELGWRGYMLPRMARTRSGRKAVLVHSVIWWVWHLPLLIGGACEGAIMSVGEQTDLSPGAYVLVVVAVTVVGSAIPAICHGVIFAYIWMRSRSLAVVTVYHAAVNGFRDSVLVILGMGAIAGVWANGFIVILGIGLVWKADWSYLSRWDSENGDSR
jgi:membrane protease YdiL (CAAX protease family)